MAWAAITLNIVFGIMYFSQGRFDIGLYAFLTSFLIFVINHQSKTLTKTGKFLEDLLTKMDKKQ